MKSSSNMNMFPVGSRVEYESGSRGTVRYIGEVPPHNGLWLGVEWDDPTKGKHDGSHEGTSYFKTQFPLSGSFIRPNKVKQSRGASVLEAVCERYGVQSSNTGVDQKTLDEFQKRTGAKFVDFIGSEKIQERQSKIDRLHQMTLSGLGIDRPGKPGELEEHIPNVIELDLSDNRLKSWNDVAAIANQLKGLRLLNLSKNKLQVPVQPDQYADCFIPLSYLLLGEVDYTWDEVAYCSGMWPGITNLQLHFNNITTLSHTPTLKNLQRLDLQGNKINLWSEVMKLGRLPQLEILNLGNNEIGSIAFPDIPTGCTTSLFPKLRLIVLSENRITCWTSVSALDKLPSLQELRISCNPVLDVETPETNRQLLIAKIRRLQMVNSTCITERERKGAEIDYLKRFGAEWNKVKDLTVDDHLRRCFLNAHPRYLELVGKHGAPEEGEMHNVFFTGLINTRLLTVYGCLQGKESMAEKYVFPPAITVRKVKQALQKSLQLPGSNFGLLCISGKDPKIKFELVNDYKNLEFYSVEDGDMLVIQ